MKKLFNFDKSINSLLYVLQTFGGITDMHKLCKILYFADQKHLSEYGRSITGDTYIAMQYGPVPSCVDDILKALRGDSFFSSNQDIQDLKHFIHFENRFMVVGEVAPDLDVLSPTDVECLDFAINICKDKNFAELTAFSHGLAWGNTRPDREISVKDILREVGDDEDYVEYIAENLRQQSAFL